MDQSYKPTTHGLAVMAACLALERPLVITRVAFGSGKAEEGTSLADMHELISYISDGEIVRRKHEDDRFMFTIQFSTFKHQEVKTFLLSEFLVFAEDPETGDETDLIYGTLGDYRQPVPAFNPMYPPSTFNLPLTLILSNEINACVTAPAGLVTYTDMEEEIAESIDDLKRQLFAGEITMQLATRDGEELATRSGDLILARRRLFTPEDAAQQAETLRSETRQLVDATAAALTAQTAAKLSAHDASAASHAVLTAQTDTKLREHDASASAHQPLTAQTDAKFSAHNREVFAGEITEPLATRDGNALTTQDGTPIVARRRLFTPEDADQLRTETRQLVDTSAETLTARMDAKISTHNVVDNAHPVLAAKLGEQTDAKISTHNASPTSHPALTEQADTKLDSHNASAAAHSALAAALASQMDSKISAHDVSEESHPTHLAIRTITNEEDDNNGS